MATRPRLVAIAGCSCAGKTRLAQRLAEELGASVLPLDHYYPDLHGLDPAARERTNFDDPACVDTESLFDGVRRLAGGSPIERPVYDFATHTRTGRTERVEAARYVVLEGLFALVWPELRTICQTKVYVDLDEESCFRRRLERDMRERGRTQESILRQFEQTVRPMARLHVIPTRAFADIVVNGADPIGVQAASVLAKVREDR